MGITDVLSGLKGKVIDAATYDLLRRNFELLEENYLLTKDQVDSLKEEVKRLKAKNLKLHGEKGELWAEIDLLKRKI